MTDGSVSRFLFNRLVGGVSLATLCFAIAGCDGGPKPASADPARVPSSTAPPRWHDGELPALRYQLDATRNQLWVLDGAAVDVFDVTERLHKYRVAFQDWIWVGEPYSCAPALALEPSGAALVASNVLPTLRRIDPETFTVTRHELSLDADADKDVGFTGLAFAEQGTLLAVSGSHGSLWRVDLWLNKAEKVELSKPVHGACGLATRPGGQPPGIARPLVLCVPGAGRAWQISLSPDLRRGHVVEGPC
jgi:hypothetical protein